MLERHDSSLQPPCWINQHAHLAHTGRKLGFFLWMPSSCAWFLSSVPRLLLLDKGRQLMQGYQKLYQTCFKSNQSNISRAVTVVRLFRLTCYNSMNWTWLGQVKQLNEHTCQWVINKRSWTTNWQGVNTYGLVMISAKINCLPIKVFLASKSNGNLINNYNFLTFYWYKLSSVTEFDTLSSKNT